MRKNTYLWTFAVVVLCGLVVVWLSTSTQGSTKTYELRPNIEIPESKTDAVRAIDAYERLMERYMNMTEKSLFDINKDSRDVVKKLDSIDIKLTQLSARIAVIEKALGIKQPNYTIEGKVPPESLDKQPQKKTQPSTEK